MEPFKNLNEKDFIINSDTIPYKIKKFCWLFFTWN